VFGHDNAWGLGFGVHPGGFGMGGTGGSYAGTADGYAIGFVTAAWATTTGSTGWRTCSATAGLPPLAP
jgi:hypothetical protein